MKWSTLLAAVLFFLQKPVSGYKAAILEYQPTVADTAQNTILKNLEEYRKFAEKAAAQQVDILVFPEYGLTTLVVDPEDYAVKITNTNENVVIKKLRLLARDHRMYIVVNLLEMVGEQEIYYNTNLVFDRTGSVIAKYRKINLFNEPKLAPGLANQTVTFVTDFGVNFGLFTCFDILYWNPSRTVLANGAVRDVVYPTSWFSTTPFYASLTVQHGYAVSTGVNLLAANYGVPPETHGGSGIYLPGDKTAKIYLDAKYGSKLVIQNVPNQKNKQNTTCISAVAQHLSQESNISNYVTLRNFEASRYKFRRVNLAQKNQSVRICYHKFCCTFDLSVNTQRVTSDIFKVMAFDGVVPFDRSTAHIRVCSLVACRDDSHESCGARVTTATKFDKMAVYGNLERDDTTFYTPLTLNYNLLPITKSLFCDNKRANGSIELSTTEPQQNVLVFGLFGRTNSIVAE